MSELNTYNPNMQAGSQVDATTADYHEPVKNPEVQKQWAKEPQFSANDIVSKLAQGDDTQEISRNLLSNLVKKVSDKALPIQIGRDRAKKDSKLESEIKLLFGSEESTDDQISISSEARVAQLQDKAVKERMKSQPKDTQQILEEAGEEGLLEGLGSEEALHEAIYKENTEVRAKLQQNDDIYQKIFDESENLEAEIEAEEVDLEEKKGEEDSIEDERERVEKEEEIDGIDDESVMIAEDMEEDDGLDERVMRKQSGRRKIQKIQKKEALKVEEVLEEDGEDILAELEKSFAFNQNDLLKKKIEEIKETEGNDLEIEVEDEGDTEDSSLDDSLDDELDGEDDDISVDAKRKKAHKDVKESKEEFSSDTGRDQGESKGEQLKTGAKRGLTKDKAIQKYLDTFEKAVKKGHLQTEELRGLEQKYLKEGLLTSRQIKDLQLAIRKSIRQDISEQLQERVINRQLTKGTRFDYLQAETALNNLMEQIEGHSSLGGKDFGNFKDGISGLVNDTMFKAGRKLNFFAMDSMQEKLMEANVSKDPDAGKNFIEHMNKMEEITNDSGVVRDWYMKYVEKIEDDQGFKPVEFELEDRKELGQKVDIQAGLLGDGSSNQEKNQEQTISEYEYTQDDKKSILINRLRALYMQRALNPGVRSILKTDFKIRKLKNGLMRLGVYTEVLNEEIKEEAKEVAQERTIEMLKEALIERASLYSLAGNTYKVTENKIKGIIKNASTFGFNVTQIVFNQLRDEANSAMFEITRRELNTLEVRMSDADIPELVVKYRQMTQLLDRLKEESGLEEEYSSNEYLESITIAEEA
jgi:hypothetical protein